MKIIDTFMFFDENMMLDIRLNILDKYINKFIICESTYNHNGEAKKLNFDLNLFSKFRSKIVYVVLEKKPENLRKINDNDNKDLKQSKILDNALIRENFQRNYVQNELKKIDEEDLILVNDLDEIPNLEKFVYKKKITIFQQRLQYFKLNLSYPNYLWSGSKICKKKHLISPQWLRNVKTRKYPIWRPDLILSNKKYNNIEIIKDGGWHFTNIKSAEEIHHKMTNFLHHYEYQNSGLNSEDIKKLIKRKKALYNYAADQRENKWKNNPELVKIELDNLPSYISTNKKKFESWID